MKIAEVTGVGRAKDVVDCVEIADIAAPGIGEARVKMLACPINPADILQIEGGHASHLSTPCRTGAEGVGIVESLGQDVKGLIVGDLVINRRRQNWVQTQILSVFDLIRLPAEIDIRQAAMLKVNPATATLMLSDFVALKPKDWIIQNAANSGVGLNVIQLARKAGLRTLNVVRREDAVDRLLNEGGDIVLVDGPNLAQRVTDATGGDLPRLALDAIAGPNVTHLADCLSNSGIIVTYGLLSGEPCQITASQLIFNNIRLSGFSLTNILNKLTPKEVNRLYGKLAQNIIDGTLSVKIEKAYPLTKIKDALFHAKKEHRHGKIIILPND